MPEISPEQKKLIVGRKAARVTFVLFLFGGAIIFLYGIFTAYLPTVWNGAVLFAGSILPFFISKKLEEKLSLPTK